MNNKDTTQWWLLSRDTLLKDLKTDSQRGLSQEEAKKRLETYGPNTIIEPTAVSAIKLFMHQFWNLIIVVLLAAVALAWFIGSKIDALVILSIVIINAIIGFIQEYGAEQSLAALRRITKPLARVIRAGN